MAGLKLRWLISGALKTPTLLRTVGRHQLLPLWEIKLSGGSPVTRPFLDLLGTAFCHTFGHYCGICQIRDLVVMQYCHIMTYIPIHKHKTKGSGNVWNPVKFPPKKSILQYKCCNQCLMDGEDWLLVLVVYYTILYPRKSAWKGLLETILYGIANH